MAVVAELLGRSLPRRYASPRMRPPVRDEQCECLNAGRVALIIHCMAAGLFAVVALAAGAIEVALLIAAAMAAAVGVSWSIGAGCECVD